MNRSFCISLVSCFLALASLQAREASGIVLPFKEVVVSAATENTVSSVEVEIGTSVKAGVVLARLDSRIHELQVARFERVLDMSEATFLSTSELGKENIISREEALKSEIERDLAKNQLAVSKVELSRQKIVSPLDGIVVEVMKEAGETVKKSEEMFVVVNIDKVYLQVFLSAADVGKVRVGEQLEIQFPNMPQEGDVMGEVFYIDPRIDANSGMLRARILIDNPDHLIKPGARGFLSFSEQPEQAGGRGEQL